MSQNLISANFSAETIARMDAALATLEEIFAPFSDITADALEGLPRMGEKSEPFCRQTALVLDQNLAVIPPSVDFKGLKEDFADLDALRPRLLRLRERCRARRPIAIGPRLRPGKRWRPPHPQCPTGS